MPTQTFSFTLQVVDSEGRVATIADSIQVADAPVGVTPVISLQPRTIFATGETTQGASRTISASFTLAASGRLSTSEGVTSASEWGINVAGADYEARFTPLSGATFTGTATGAWTAINALSWADDLTTTAANGQPVSQLTSGTLEIRDVATQTVQATAVISFDLRITVITSAVSLSDQTFSTYALGLDPSPLYNFNSITLFSDGRLAGYGGPFSENELRFVPNEWGPNQNASAYEARFTLLVKDPQHSIAPGTVFGTWQNLAFYTGYMLEMNFTGIGEYESESTVRVEIRPIGGAVIASAVHTIAMRGARYPTGIIP